MMIAKILYWNMLFFMGGSAYIGLELAWRNYSHWSMFIAGGICFSLLTAIHQKLPAQTPLFFRCLLGSFTITCIEFITGLIVNVWLGWNIWDYSSYRFQVLGQISLMYSIFWFFLSAPVFWVSAYFLRSFPQVSSKIHSNAKTHPKTP